MKIKKTNKKAAKYKHKHTHSYNPKVGLRFSNGSSSSSSLCLHEPSTITAKGSSSSLSSFTHTQRFSAAVSAVANQPTNHPTVAPVVEAGVGSKFPREKKKARTFLPVETHTHTHILACKNWWLSDSGLESVWLTDWLSTDKAAAAWAWAWELVWHQNEGAQKWNARRQLLLLLLLLRQKLCRQTRHWNGQQTKEVSAAAENGKRERENARNLQNRGIGEKESKESKEIKESILSIFCFFLFLFSRMLGNNCAERQKKSWTWI